MAKRKRQPKTEQPEDQGLAYSEADKADMRYIGQSHLLPGLCLHKVMTILDKHLAGVDWLKVQVTSELIGQIKAEINGLKK